MQSKKFGRYFSAVEENCNIKILYSAGNIIMLQVLLK